MISVAVSRYLLSHITFILGPVCILVNLDDFSHLWRCIDFALRRSGLSNLMKLLKVVLVIVRNLVEACKFLLFFFVVVPDGILVEVYSGNLLDVGVNLLEVFIFDLLQL